MTEVMRDREEQAQKAAEYIARMQAEAITGEKPITLGELIKQLEALDPDMPISFAKDLPIGPFESWRGSYDMLSLPSGGGGDFWNCDTVFALLGEAERAVGNSFTGYKGGEYYMDENTFVWSDEYGECDGWAVMGVEQQQDRAIVITKFIDSAPAIWGRI